MTGDVDGAPDGVHQMRKSTWSAWAHTLDLIGCPDLGCQKEKLGVVLHSTIVHAGINYS